MRFALAFVAVMAVAAAGPVAVLARGTTAGAAPTSVALEASAGVDARPAPPATAVTQVSPPVDADARPADGPKAESLLVRMNAARHGEGLAALQRDSLLDAAASARAEDMARLGYFAHYGPAGQSAFSALDALGVPYRIAGENLARNTYPEASALQVAFDGLMASPTHRANILEPRFSRVGIAVVRDGTAWLFVTVFKD